MKYKELKDPCKTLIEKELCLGCNKLELSDFQGDINCKYAKKPTVQESIEQIKLFLGIDNEERTEDE